jgi:hypothetical protein
MSQSYMPSCTVDNSTASFALSAYARSVIDFNVGFDAKMSVIRIMKSVKIFMPYASVGLGFSLSLR